MGFGEFLVVATVGVGLSGCSSSNTPDAYALNGPAQQDGVRGDLPGDSGIEIGIANKTNRPEDTGGDVLGVNAYLWRGALDTLSFMPPASGERFKVTDYILGGQARIDGVWISVFRQGRSGGQWVDAPVSAVAIGNTEGKVLAHAREPRIQSASR